VGEPKRFVNQRWTIGSKPERVMELVEFVYYQDRSFE